MVAALLTLAVVYPFLAPMIPAHLPAPTTNNLIVMCYYAVLALGLNIVVGFAGLLDLGYVAFYVFGAYTAAFLGSPQFGIHVPWLLIAPVAVAAAALAGILLGAPTLRLRGDYLAIVTLGFGQIIPQLVRNLDKVNVVIGGMYIIGPDKNLTGGALGINPVDALTLPIAGPWGSELVFSNANPHASFYLVLAILLISFFVCRRLRDGRLGRAWMAIREDETAAAMMGIDTVTTKLLAFALTYVSQTLLPFLGRLVDPSIQAFGMSLHVDLLANFTLVSMNYLIFGLLLVLMMVFRPEGLLPARAQRAELHHGELRVGEVQGLLDAEAEAQALREAEAAWFSASMGGVPIDGVPSGSKADATAASAAEARTAQEGT